MKKQTFTICLLLLGVCVVCQTKPNVFFIAVDSWEGTDGRITSRILINSPRTFNHPNEIDIFTDSIASTFGFILIEKYDNNKNEFNKFHLGIHVDRVTDKVTQPLKSTNQLNLLVQIAPAGSFQSGLYRAKVKVFLSRYNVHFRDVISNWSYFYIK